MKEITAKKVVSATRATDCGLLRHRARSDATTCLCADADRQVDLNTCPSCRPRMHYTRGVVSNRCRRIDPLHARVIEVLTRLISVRGKNRSGHYLTPDPIGLEGGTNLYGYADGDPVGKSNP